MTYRRDAQLDESIPLPIEMVYNSFTDTITDVDPETGFKSYFKGNTTQFNRIYFRYPPEWITSDVGEKIIGVRNMKISIRQRMSIEFTLYIRKYRQDKFNELAAPLYDDIEDLDDDEIQDVVNRMDPKDVKVFKIDYANDIYDDIDDFIQDVYEAIDRETLYFKLRDAIYESEQTKDEKIAAQEQLEKDKDNYRLMCLRNDVPFYLYNNDENGHNIRDFIICEEIGDNIWLIFYSAQNDHDEFYVDIMMTTTNEDATYKKFYQWDDDKDEPLPYTAVHPGVLDDDDRFDFDTASYFNIGSSNPSRNSIAHITKFHRELIFTNVMTSLECEVAASFACQSNHNLIGRTNEIFNPIKYYKLNDKDDKFWIEFYDRNEITVPVAFNDYVMFTMDVVFLQNRKLLYS